MTSTIGLKLELLLVRSITIAALMSGSHGVYFYDGYGEEDEDGCPGPDRRADLAEEYLGGEEIADKDHEKAA